MGINKRNEEQMKKILARSKAAEKKEQEQKKLAKRGKGKYAAKNKNAEDAAALTKEEKAALKKKYSHMVIVEEAGPKATHEEPPYSYEIHGRRNSIIVTVQLHKIPDQYIDIDSTTARKLVVDTSKYSKKWHLDFPFPGGMRVDLAKADYTLDSGVLKCVFPIDNMPESVAEEHQKMMDGVRADRKMRFKYDANGELTVRKRKTVMAVPPQEKGKGKETAPNSVNQRGKRNRDAEDDSADEADEAPKKKAGKKSTKGKSATELAAEKRANDEIAKIQKEFKMKNAADAPKNPKKASVSDDATMRMIQEAAKTAGQATKKKQIEAKQRDEKAEARSVSRDQKKGQKKETMNQSFQSLVASQRARLEERRAMAAPVQRKTGGKSVSFQ